LRDPLFNQDLSAADINKEQVAVYALTTAQPHLVMVEWVACSAFISSTARSGAKHQAHSSLMKKATHATEIRREADQE
jgi:hypothetical protein